MPFFPTFTLLQASPLTVLLFAPYSQPLSGPQTRSKKKALVECPINVHENTVKTREFSGVYFHLKGRSWPGPTKLILALSAEGSHREALPTTACRMISPLITNNQLNCWFDFFNSTLIL